VHSALGYRSPIDCVHVRVEDTCLHESRLHSLTKAQLLDDNTGTKDLATDGSLLQPRTVCQICPAFRCCAGLDRDRSRYCANIGAVAMATPRTLSRPPITEALIDIRFSTAKPQETFENFARQIQDRFPEIQIRRGIKAEIRVEQGKLIPPSAEDTGFQGILVKADDGTRLAQFRPDGFTFNNIKSYIGGDQLVTLALGLWSEWVAFTEPVSVTRVAFRYINELHLPLHGGDEFKKYLTAAPEPPPGAPQHVSEFLTRVVSHDISASATAIFTQHLTVREAGDPVVLIDVDVFKEDDFAGRIEEMHEVLRTLRQIKNATFFSLLTDEAVALYE
jgi:uncharacterized protein (TIGR04255 family)